MIGPPLNEPSTNAWLIPNTRVTSAWATRQSLKFVEWRFDLNGWVVLGGDVPIEWCEKNAIVGVPKSNPATGSTKRSRGKSPPLEDKPKKVRRKRASVEKPKNGSPKPPTTIQFGSGAAPATKSSVPAVAYASTFLPLKQYRRKANAGRIKVPKSSEEVFLESPYLLTSFLSFFFSSLPSFMVLTICCYGFNSPMIVKRHSQRSMILRIQLLTLVNYYFSLRFLLVFPLLMSFIL